MNYQTIIDSYINWIRDNTFVNIIKEGDIYEITSPFLDRHNDQLQVYFLKQPDNSIKITDDGFVIQDLIMAGADINTPKRLQVFRSVLNGFGVKVDDKQHLYTEANISNIGQKKHSFIQAMLSISDMYTFAQETVYSFFKEDVELYFKKNEIFYTKDIKITGKSGFDHNIDFIISASRSLPERLVKAINYPRKDPITAAIFSFNDIAAIRDQKSKNYVFYNDTLGEDVSADAIAALQNYNVVSVPWSKVDSYKQEFLSN